jgi:hypothetical protein
MMLTTLGFVSQNYLIGVGLAISLNFETLLAGFRVPVSLAVFAAANDVRTVMKTRVPGRRHVADCSVQ